MNRNRLSLSQSSHALGGSVFTVLAGDAANADATLPVLAETNAGLFSQMAMSVLSLAAAVGEGVLVRP